jgi:hypothetical protein
MSWLAGHTVAQREPPLCRVCVVCCCLFLFALVCSACLSVLLACCWFLLVFLRWRQQEAAVERDALREICAWREMERDWKDTGKRTKKPARAEKDILRRKQGWQGRVWLQIDQKKNDLTRIEDNMRPFPLLLSLLVPPSHLSILLSPPPPIQTPILGWNHHHPSFSFDSFHFISFHSSHLALLARSPFLTRAAPFYLLLLFSLTRPRARNECVLDSHSPA